MAEQVERTLGSAVKEKVGVLPENIEMELENLNTEREKRLQNCITNEVNFKNLQKKVAHDVEELWKNFEIEETQVKLELSEMVLEQLLNEVVEIMEHVQLSRKNPALYLYKSIYACEEIPRLSFQVNNNTQEFNEEVNQ